MLHNESIGADAFDLVVNDGSTVAFFDRPHGCTLVYYEIVLLTQWLIFGMYKIILKCFVSSHCSFREDT